MKRKILLIEDNENNRYLTCLILEKKGFEVISAETGLAGIELAGKNKPDLILLDIQLPGMDGYQIARELKNNPQLKHIPIVAVTSFAMVGDREKIFAAGVQGYIEKPINAKTFAEEVTAFLIPNQKKSFL